MAAPSNGRSPLRPALTLIGLVALVVGTVDVLLTLGDPDGYPGTGRAVQRGRMGLRGGRHGGLVPAAEQPARAPLVVGGFALLVPNLANIELAGHRIGAIVSDNYNELDLPGSARLRAGRPRSPTIHSARASCGMPPNGSPWRTLPELWNLRVHPEVGTAPSRVRLFRNTRWSESRMINAGI